MPLQSSLQNLKEKLTALGTAAYAVGLEDHRATLADHRQRVRDSHAAQAKAAGIEIDAGSEDNVGDLIITGDIQINDKDKPVVDTPKADTPVADDTPKAEEPTQPEPVTPAPTPQPNGNKLRDALLAGLVGAGLVGGGVGLGNLLAPRESTTTLPAPVDTDTDSRNEYVPTLEPRERTDDAESGNDEAGR